MQYKYNNFQTKKVAINCTKCIDVEHKLPFINVIFTANILHVLDIIKNVIFNHLHHHKCKHEIVIWKPIYIINFCNSTVLFNCKMYSHN